MKLRLEHFSREHIRLFQSFGKQVINREFFPLNEEALMAAENCQGWSGFFGDVYLGAGGLMPLGPARALAWFLHNDTGNPRHFVILHKLVRRILRGGLTRYARIEAYVDPDFPEAVRWVKLLGFHCETAFKPFYFPDGRPASEWVLLREQSEWQQLAQELRSSAA